MTADDLIRNASQLFGPHQANIDYLDWLIWLNEGQDILVERSAALMGPKYRTLANGAGAAETPLIVDDVKYFNVGDKVDVILPATEAAEVDNIEVTAINETTNTMTLASNQTWTDNSEVYLHDGDGLIDIVSGQSLYEVPRDVVVLDVALLDQPFYVVYENGTTKRDLTFTSSSRIGFERGAYHRQKTAAAPAVFMMEGVSTFRIFPEPSAAVTRGLRLHFARRALPLVDPSDIPEFPETMHVGLSYYAAYRAELNFRQDDGRLQRFTGGFEAVAGALQGKMLGLFRRGTFVQPPTPG